MDKHANISEMHRSYSFENSINTPIDMRVIIVLHWIIYAIFAQIVVVFGTISNVINILCFARQGFKESINVSLTGLAISDLGCLLPLTWTNLCYTPAFSDLDLPFEASEVQYMTTGLAHVIMTRVSSWITAMITLERCLCVAMPLKVKEIVTQRRTFIAVLIIFVILIGSGAPEYYYYRLGAKYFPDRNQTLVGIMYSQKLKDVQKYSYPINFVFVQFLAFFVIIICTIILVIELNISAEWRKKSSAVSTNTSQQLARSNKVAKMVVMISALFIGCFITVIIGCLLMSVIPDFSIHGKFRHLLTVLGGLGFLMESVNSSLNIFIYYGMSTKYREVFRGIFSLKRVNSCEQ